MDPTSSWFPPSQPYHEWRFGYLAVIACAISSSDGTIPDQLSPSISSAWDISEWVYSKSPSSFHVRLVSSCVANSNACALDFAFTSVY